MKCLSEPELDGLVCMWTALGRQCAGKFIKKNLLSSKILFMVLKLVLASNPAGKLPLLVHVAAILVL